MQLEDSWRETARQKARRGQVCPVCLGLEWVKSGDFPVDHPDFGKMERCPACQGGRLPEYLRHASGLRGWHLGASFADYIQIGGREVQLQHVQALLKRGHGWLTLWGGYGTGKTYLLAAAVNESLRRRRPAVYTTASELLDRLRDAYGPGGPGFSKAFEQWATCQLLAVDEIDQFHATQWATDKLRALLAYRYDLAAGGDSVTLFATNAEPGGDDWPADLGWLVSRMSQWDIIKTRGGDVRPIIGGG